MYTNNAGNNTTVSQIKEVDHSDPHLFEDMFLTKEEYDAIIQEEDAFDEMVEKEARALHAFANDVREMMEHLEKTGFFN